jgi:hypothetical protein
MRNARLLILEMVSHTSLLLMLPFSGIKQACASPDKIDLFFPESFFFLHRVNVYILSYIQSLLLCCPLADLKNINTTTGRLLQMDLLTESNWVTLNKKK